MFWALEGRAARDPSRSFQGHKWELLHNYTCVDGSALDLLIRVRGQPGKEGMGQGSRDRDEGCSGPG